MNKEYKLRPSEDVPTIFDRISEKRVKFLSQYIIKDLAELIEDYIRYDWFSLIAEAILMNVCRPHLDYYSEEAALELLKKVRQRLIDNVNDKVLGRYSRKNMSDYPLDKMVTLFKKKIKKDGDHVWGDTNQICFFDGLLYRFLDSQVNYDQIGYCNYTSRLILHNALAKLGIDELSSRGISSTGISGTTSVSIYRMLWPHGKKRSFFFLPGINKDDIDDESEDEDEDEDDDDDSCGIEVSDDEDDEYSENYEGFVVHLSDDDSDDDKQYKENYHGFAIHLSDDDSE